MIFFELYPYILIALLVALCLWQQRHFSIKTNDLARQCNDLRIADREHANSLDFYAERSNNQEAKLKALDPATPVHDLNASLKQARKQRTGIFKGNPSITGQCERKAFQSKP